MRTSLLFEPADPRFVASFIGRHPHAKVVSACGDDLEAAPLPLSAKTDDSRAVLALIGHFARANRHTLPLAAPRRDLLRALVFAACVKSERARGRLRRHHRRDAEKRKSPSRAGDGARHSPLTAPPGPPDLITTHK